MNALVIRHCQLLAVIKNLVFKRVKRKADWREASLPGSLHLNFRIPVLENSPVDHRRLESANIALREYI